MKVSSSLLQSNTIYNAEEAWQLRLKERSWSMIPGHTAEESYKLYESHLKQALQENNPFVNGQLNPYCRVLLLGGFSDLKPSPFCNGMTNFLKNHQVDTEYLIPLSFNGVNFHFCAIKDVRNGVGPMPYRSAFSWSPIVLIIPNSVEDFKRATNLLVKYTNPADKDIYFYNPFQNNTEAYQVIVNSVSQQRAKGFCYSSVNKNVLADLSELVMKQYRAVLDQAKEQQHSPVSDKDATTKDSNSRLCDICTL